MAEVSARLSRPVTWQGEPISQHFVVEIVQEPTAYRAVLSVRSATGAQSTRVFHTDSCANAVVALALVAALSIDPNASSSVGSALASREPPPESNRPAPPRSTPAPSSRLELGPVVAVAAGLAPVALVMAGAEIGASIERFGALTPRVGLAVQLGRTGVVGPAADESTFTWLIARASACPLRVGHDVGFSLRPCAVADAGWMLARGNPQSVLEPRTAGRFWLALGAGLRAAHDWERAFVALSAGALANVTRNTYILENPRLPVYETAFATWTAQTALGLRW